MDCSNLERIEKFEFYPGFFEAMCNQPNRLEELILNGTVDINAVCRGRSLLDMAISFESIDCVEVLIKFGVDASKYKDESEMKNISRKEISTLLQTYLDNDPSDPFCAKQPEE